MTFGVNNERFALSATELQIDGTKANRPLDDRAFPKSRDQWTSGLETELPSAKMKGKNFTTKISSPERSKYSEGSGSREKSIAFLVLLFWNTVRHHVQGRYEGLMIQVPR